MLSTDVRSILTDIYICQEHHHFYLQTSGTSSLLSTDVKNILHAIYRCQEHHHRYLQISEASVHYL